MDHERDLLDLLSSPTTQMLAFHPLGAEVVAIPDRLTGLGAQAPDLGVVSPLEAFDTESQGKAVVAFEGARRTGRGTAVVNALHTTQPMRLDIFDLEASDGCFVGVLTPTSVQVTVGDIDTLPVRQATLTMGAAGTVESVSPELAQMLGWSAEELIGTSTLDIIHPDDHEAGIISWVAVLENPGEPSRMRQRFKRTDGHWVWCEATDTNYLDDPARGYVLTELVDISREMEAQQALQRRETMLDRLQQALPTGVLHLDEHGAAAVWNDRWAELTGADPAAGIDGLRSRLADPVGFQAAFDRALAEGVDADLDVTLDRTGRCEFGVLHLRPLQENGTPFGILLTLDDVTRSRTHQLELADQARRDVLTGSLNRMGIEEVLADRLAANESQCSVLFLDLDDFKAINDRFGHQIGDEVLVALAAEVSSLMRPQDAFGRLGGDEFLVVVDGDWDAGELERLADRIDDAARAVEQRFEQLVSVGVTVGFAKASSGDRNDDVLKRADQAMYRKKRERKALAAADT